MNRTYKICVGTTYLVANDSWPKVAENAEAAILDALGWAAEMQWPRKPVDYDAWVWVEEDGKIVAEEQVRIYADGRLSLPS